MLTHGEKGCQLAPGKGYRMVRCFSRVASRGEPKGRLALAAVKTGRSGLRSKRALIFAVTLLAAPPASADPLLKAAAAKKAHVLAEFVSATCPACEEMKPVFAEVLRRNPELVHQVHDADEQVELAKKYKVRCVPVYVVVDPQGTVRFNDVGVRTTEELLEILRRAGFPAR